TSQVVVEIGDSDLPPAPQSGGSGLATALSTAIHAAAGNLLRAFLDLAPGGAPLHGRSPDEVAVADGCIHLIADPSAGLAYTDLLAGGALIHGTPGGQS